MDAPISTTEAETELMARYGITCVMIPQYLYKTWRYTNLSDAVAQARRAGNSPPVA